VEHRRNGPLVMGVPEHFVELSDLVFMHRSLAVVAGCVLAGTDQRFSD
jgi:hypothetical protein